MREKTVSYIKNTHVVLLETKENVFFTDISVYIKDPLPESISLNKTLRSLERIIPKHLVSYIDAIYVGAFDQFKDKETNAAYSGGALYISNEQDDMKDMIDDIVHEIGHAASEQYARPLYSDGDIEREFLYKRKKLYELLEAYGYDVNYKEFLNSEYSENFDNLLYKQIGYDKLDFFTTGLFLDNYSVTSLEEYFSTGFEKYYLEDPQEVMMVCPVLYNKIATITHLEDEI